MRFTKLLLNSSTKGHIYRNCFNVTNYTRNQLYNYEPHNQRYHYSNSDNINANSRSNIYDHNNANIFCKPR